MTAVLALALLTSIPPGAVPAGRGNGFPLSWLWSWIPAAPSWAAPPPTPRQEQGTAAGKAHYVAAGVTRAKAGAAKGKTGKGKGQLDAYEVRQPAKRKKKVGTPSVAGRDHFDAATSTRIADKSTANQNVYRNADGTYTRRVSEGPINYKAADGRWTPIDTGLARGADGRWHQKSNALSVDFAASADSTTLTTIGVDRAHGFSYRLQGAAKVAAIVSGPTATYRNVLTDTDLELRTTAVGVKESIILRSADAPTTFVFPLQLRGLTPRLESDGSVSLLTSAGAVSGVIPAGLMEDAYVDPRSNEHHESKKVAYRMVTVAGAPALQVTADPAWVHASSTVFPVTVDPTFSGYGTNGTTYAETSTPGNNSTAKRMKVGTSDGGSSIKAYSFMQFTGFASSFANTQVTSATLHLFDSWAWNCDAHPFWINPITTSWSPSTVTKYPGPSFSSTAIGSDSETPGAACTNTGGDPKIGKWMSVGLAGSTFDSWVKGTSSNFGLAITASQTDSTQWKQFDAAYGPYPPYLDVTYTGNTPPVIDSQYPINNASPTTLQPELMAHGTDPDGWPGKGVTYDFVVYSLDDNAVVADSGALSTGDWRVPAGALLWGKTYWWTVRIADGGPLSNDPSSTIRFLNMNVPQPPITSGLSQNSGGHDFDPKTGNYTTSATDAQVATVGPALSVVRAYNSSDPRTAQAFGAGWSSVADGKAVEQIDPMTGVISTVTVTYPTGSEVTFGRDNDGSFAAPQGHFSTFKTVAGGGYTLTD